MCVGRACSGIKQKSHQRSGPEPSSAPSCTQLPSRWAIPLTQLKATAGHLRGAGKGAQKVRGVHPR